jgi:hypothetical protein
VPGTDDAGDVFQEGDATDDGQGSLSADGTTLEMDDAEAGQAVAADAADGQLGTEDVQSAGPDVVEGAAPKPDAAAGPPDAAHDATPDMPDTAVRDARPDVAPPFDAASCASFLLSPTTNVVASTIRTANYANQVIDKNFTTRWESMQQLDQPGGAGGPPLPPQWVYIDFGAMVYITDVQIDWQNACAASYDLQVSSDAVNWATMPGGGVIGNNKGTLTPPTDWSTATDTSGLSGVGRYLRVYCTLRCQPMYGYSIWEMRVFGHGVTSCGP